MKDVNELFWNAHIDDLKKGYAYNESGEEYICLICGKAFSRGIIYRGENDLLYEAWKYAGLHVAWEHDGGIFEYLLNMDKKYSGITGHQKNILRYFNEGKTDKEIASKLGDISASTVRNHRFTMREREKQSKIFLAIMQLVSNHDEKRGEEFIEHQRAAEMVDERYAITREEMKEIIEKYFKHGPDGPITEFPKKEKRRLAILIQISGRFEAGKNYTEKQVNELLEKIHPRDYVTMRRALVDYGFVERVADGSRYWLKI